MMRSDQRHVLGVALLGLAVAWGAGCKKEEPAASAPVDAGGVAVAAVDAGPVAKVVKRLRFSDVSLKRLEESVNVTYTLTNPGTAQGRGAACMMLLDERNLAITLVRLGGIAVKGGLADTFEDQVKVADLQWNQARSVMLFTTAYGAYCTSRDLKEPTSEPFRLLTTGEPASAALPMPAPPQESKPEDFAVSGVRVSRTGSSGRSSIFFTVKNVSDHRASGAGCLRAYAKEGARALEELDVGDFDLAPKASTTLTESFSFDDDTHWGEVTVLRFFASGYGCADTEGPNNPGQPFNTDGGEAQNDAQ
ncbi:hypothetical protein JYJ95_35870 [Corallococcus exiguus]|uniref:hypothetical protein n=1 Tax=Corallococcus exiguus TaxID=83462 RepID=UPI001A9093C1|nr:hypothetical protein [Corallococcus exiguus]MBN8471917.1 hypothetical protein [Corallococcus exiguus]